MSHTPPPAVRAVGIAIGVSILLGALVSWFAWPARELAPRDLPIVVAGPAPATAAISQQLSSALPGAFEVTTVADAAAGDQALRDRTAYAAFVVGADGVSLHTASGASPAVAALLREAAQRVGGDRPVTVVDVVPGAADDLRGTGFASGYLPLVLASMIGGIVLAVVLAGWRDRLIGLGALAVMGGLIGAGVLHLLGVIAGGYWAAAGVIGLLTLAVSGTVLGLAAALGAAGIGLGVLVVFLFGNPISAVASAPELLPQPWGTIGQLLPPGAGATLLRSEAFFNGAGSVAPLWTLLAWASLGAILVVVGRVPITGSPGAARRTTEASVAA